MKLINKLRHFYNRKKETLRCYYLGFNKVDLIIYDNIYPHPISGFRFEEITTLIKEFRNVRLLLDGKSYSTVKTPKDKHKQHINQLVQSYTFINKSKISTNGWFVNVKTNFFYCIFINNIFKNIAWIEKYEIPFIFTLYPGGGFEVDNQESDAKLRKVLRSPMFRKVVVTQEFTLQYLKRKAFCDASKIVLIFGGVVPQISIQADLEKKSFYPITKGTLDVCFCATKYMKEGKDKGYDVFIKAAKELAKKHDFVRLHVIGGFDEKEIDLDEISDLVTFYGYVEYFKLKNIFKEMDLFVSPNKSFTLSKGAFDGFPLGTAVEAALNGVVVLATDELKENSIFENQTEIIIIESTCESIVKEIESLILEPERMHRISNKGREKFKFIYSNDYQMKERIELISKAMRE